MFQEKWDNSKESLNPNSQLSMLSIMLFVYRDQARETYLHGRVDQLIRQLKPMMVKLDPYFMIKPKNYFILQVWMEKLLVGDMKEETLSRSKI